MKKLLISTALTTLLVATGCTPTSQTSPQQATSVLSAKSTPQDVTKKLAGQHTLKAIDEGENECYVIELTAKAISPTALRILPTKATQYENKTCTGKAEVATEEDLGISDESPIAFNITKVAPSKKQGFLTLSADMILPMIKVCPRDQCGKPTADEQAYQAQLEKILSTDGMNKALLFVFSKPKGYDSDSVVAGEIEMSLDGKTLSFTSPEEPDAVIQIEIQ